ncbi:MAG TPA: GNAT family N-acetyltransferase [Candidatus Dormibacteraeota bacterium]|nr:GNAT family N-acetyltransferase [Candidatus Dormibacteraeota bacterium]
MIRTPRASEVQALVDLWVDAGLKVEPETAADELTRLLATGTDLVLVLEEGGEILGTVLGTWDGRRGWIQRLATRPGRRGQGVGTRLLEEVERRLEDMGCRKVNLLIEPDNDGVAAFYERSGYARDDLIFMEKWL